MSITLDQIAEYEERLRAEIVQRECLLAALNVFRAYSVKGQWPESLDLASLTSALIRPVHDLPANPAPLPAPAPPSLPPPPPPKRYIHPDLEAIGSRHGANSTRVKWAIERMTEDYSLREIHALLEREGGYLSSAEISVVLTRMKARGDIREVRPGNGPKGALFRRPDNPIPFKSERPDIVNSIESNAASTT